MSHTPYMLSDQLVHPSQPIKAGCKFRAQAVLQFLKRERLKLPPCMQGSGVSVGEHANEA
jgi:hypothetical protein